LQESLVGTPDTATGGADVEAAASAGAGVLDGERGNATGSDVGCAGAAQHGWVLSDGGTERSPACGDHGAADAGGGFSMNAGEVLLGGLRELQGNVLAGIGAVC